MCGFVGFSSNCSDAESHLDMLKSMCSRLEHRGPDDKGFYADHKVCLGFRRLSIIDLEFAKQPFSYDDDNYHMVFNGEIYNYLELRESLVKRGIRFSTNSEAEVMLALYKLQGKGFVERLRGMFAFLIWDKSNEQILAARDSFGIKPLYYLENDQGIFFASEMKCFLADENISSKHVDEHSLQDYMTFQFVPEPSTMMSDVHMLEAGHTLERNAAGKTTIQKYSSLQLNPTFVLKDERLSKIRRALEDSVSVHMRSDVPVGCFLSGGIDSTIIATIASKLDPNIKSFTVGFDMEGYSEVDLAKRSAEELGIENISKIITAEDFMEELPSIIWYMDTPVADPSAIPLYFIAREASKHVKVILSGEGSDELFGGYGIYHEPQSLKMFSYMPGFMKGLLKSASSKLPDGVKGKSFLERGCTPLTERYVGNAKIFHEQMKKDYLNRFDENHSFTEVTKPLFDSCRNLDDVARMQFIDMNTWLKGDILVKSDRMSMAHSLELRVPFLDSEVFKVASRLTLKDKVNGNTTKCLLREAFKDILPSGAASRKKLGYPVPIRHWLKNEMYDWVAKLIRESSAEEFINKRNTLKLLELHRTGNVDYSRKIWTLLTFMLWYEVFINEKHATMSA